MQMKNIQIAVTQQQYEIWEQVMDEIDQTAIFLAGLSHEKRLEWLRKRQYCQPISFQQEIGGTVYTVNVHFNEQASESVEEKTSRILGQ
jgi:hypothetical protein